MSAGDAAELVKWDPEFTRQVKNPVGSIGKRYFRAEVHGLDHLPGRPGRRY